MEEIVKVIDHDEKERERNPVLSRRMRMLGKLYFAYDRDDDITVVGNGNIIS